MMQSNLKSTAGLFRKRFVLLVFVLSFGLLLFVINIAKAATLVVGFEGNYAAIRSAIEAASPGDTISIAPGTYNESLVIDKSLTLSGEGAFKPIITGDVQNYIVKIEDTSGVTLNNLEINGSSLANSFQYGVLIKNSGTTTNPVEIENSIIKNIWEVDGSAIGAEVASYVLITNNIIDSFYKNGVRFVLSEGHLSSNTITGDMVDGINRVQNLINLRHGSNAEIDNNTLSYAKTEKHSTNTFHSACVFVNAYPSGSPSYANIHNNKISMCDIGVIVTSMFAPKDESSALVMDNEFYNLDLAVDIEKNTGSVTMKNNSFINVAQKIDHGEEVKPGANSGLASTSPHLRQVKTTALGTELAFSELEEKVKLTPESTNEMESLTIETKSLSASVGNIITLGTNSTLVGWLVVIVLISLIGYFSKKYRKE